MGLFQSKNVACYNTHCTSKNTRLRRLCIKQTCSKKKITVCVDCFYQHKCIKNTLDVPMKNMAILNDIFFNDYCSENNCDKMVARITRADLKEHPAFKEKEEHILFCEEHARKVICGKL